MAKAGKQLETEAGSMEAYILKLIEEFDTRLTNKDNPPTFATFQYYTGAKNILYMVLTGHNNALANPKVPKSNEK